MTTRRKASLGLSLGALVASLVASSAMAADSRAEVAIGYNHLGSQESYESYGAGIFLGVGARVAGRFGLVLEAAANSGSALNSSFDLRFRSLQAGPRLRLFSPGRAVAVHAQFLIGKSRYGERMVSPVRLEWSYQDHLILQPGLGADIALSNHAALRVGVGRSFVAFKSTPCGACAPYTDWVGQWRALIGLVVHSGSTR